MGGDGRDGDGGLCRGRLRGGGLPQAQLLAQVSSKGSACATRDKCGGYPRCTTNCGGGVATATVERIRELVG